MDIEDSPELERVLTHATAPEGYTVQINHPVVRMEMTKQEVGDLVCKLDEDISSSFADNAVDALCTSLKQMDLNLHGKIIKHKKVLEEHVEIIRKFAKGNSDLFLEYLHKQKKEFVNSKVKLGKRIDGIEQKARNWQWKLPRRPC